MSGSGLTPQDKYDNRGGGILATVVPTTFLACMVVALRLVTRLRIVRNAGWDDYTILFASFGKIIACGLIIVQVHYGFGRHKVDLTRWHYIEFMKYSYGEWIQTFQTLMFTKISICFFLLRIPVEKHLIRPIQGAIITLIVSNVVLTLLWIFQCNPIASAWNKQTPGSCFSNGQLQRIIISQALISIISDFMLALFPIVLLWKVQIAPRLKAGLCALMALGLMYVPFHWPLSGFLTDLTRLNSTAACCIVRTVMNWQNVNSDPTWESIDNWYWRSWEVCIGIVAACIPALRPGYKTVYAGIKSYISHRSSRKSSVLVDSPEANARHIARPQASYDPALGADAQAVSAEADRAREYGAGEEGFAMNYLPEDMKTADQGIKKTTRIDVSGRSAQGSQGSLELGDVERTLSNRDFL